MGSILGTVVSKSRNNVRVHAVGLDYLCFFRGKVRGRGGGQLPIAVGDKVLISITSSGEGIVEEVRPRCSELVRHTAGGKPVVVAANLDQVLLVLSAASPSPRWSLVDRVLVASHRQDLEPAICVNKTDLVRDDQGMVREIESRLALYGELGYPTFSISATTGHGVDPLVTWLRDRLTVLTGHSGVGKSPLLNPLNDRLDIVTGALSESTGKGKHTTTAVSLYSMPFGGFVADTPGFRDFALWGLEPADIGRFYREFEPHLGGCRFSDCLHSGEPDCEVVQALKRGEISKERYDSYLRIMRVHSAG